MQMKRKRRKKGVPSPEEAIPLIKRVAYRLVSRLPQNVLVEDLVGAGWIGYLGACERFDSAQGHSFEQFAEWRIRGAMLDELRCLDPLGRDIRRMVRQLKKTAHDLSVELERAPTPEELALRLGWTLERVEYLLTLGSEILEDHTDPNSRLARAVAPLHDEENRMVDFYEVLEAAAYLDQALRCLSQREEYVVRGHYFEEKQELELAIELGVTESRVCQILAESLSKLRPIYEAIVKGKQALRRTESQPAARGAADDLEDELGALQDELGSLIEQERSSGRTKR